MSRKIAVLMICCAFMLVSLNGCDNGSSTSPSATANAKYVGSWRLYAITPPGSDDFDVVFNVDNTFQVYHLGSSFASTDGTYSVTNDVLTGDWHHVATTLIGKAEARFESPGVMLFSFIELNTTNPAASNGYLRVELRGSKI